METKKGAFRYIIFTRDRVYKIPSLHYVWGVIKNIPLMIRNGDSRFIFKELRWGFINFKRGISENWSEYRCWKRMKSPFLVPTRFSLGLLNIQDRQYGVAPKQTELQYSFAKLPPETQTEMKNLEAHCLEAANFVKSRNGIFLVDYDNGTTPTAKRYPFTQFLEKWHRQLETVLIPKVQ